MTAPTIPSRAARGKAVRLARGVEATAAVLAMVTGLALVTHVVSVHAVEGESMAATLLPRRQRPRVAPRSIPGRRR